VLFVQVLLQGLGCPQAAVQLLTAVRPAALQLVQVQWVVGVLWQHYWVGLYSERPTGLNAMQQCWQQSVILCWVSSLADWLCKRHLQAQLAGWNQRL
jgi:hypothetical protein